MSTHNIGFFEELKVNIFRLASNFPYIWLSVCNAVFVEIWDIFMMAFVQNQIACSHI